MRPFDPQNNKSSFKLNGERIALLLGGALIGALVIGFSFKMAKPIVRKVCQSILEAPDRGGREGRIATVEAVAVKPGTISRRVVTIGKLRANEAVTIRSEMHGRIKEIVFKEGTMVKKGDVLLRFEDDDLQAEVDKAEAEVEYRQVRFGRFDALQAKGLGRGTEYDQERGQLNMAKAQLEVAKVKLSKATIQAPFDGKIGLIDVSVGATVDTQKDLVTLVDFDPMIIEFKAPENKIDDVGVGQTVEFKVDSKPDQIFRATVEAIDSRIDPQTHSIAVHASAPNEDGKLRAGLFASVSLIVGIKNDALLIPESAVSREGDIEFVWVITNGKAGRKRVLTGTKENNQVEVTAGLRPGELVVTSGQLKLGEGTAVKISNMGGDDVEVSDEDENAGKQAIPASKATKTDENPEAEAKKVDQSVSSALPAADQPDQKPAQAEPSASEAGAVSAEPPVENTEVPAEEGKAPPTEKAEDSTTPKGDEGAASEESTGQAEPVKNQSTEAPKDDVGGEATSEDVSEEGAADESSPEKEPEKSFFRKARDFIANKLKRTPEKL